MDIKIQNIQLHCRTCLNKLVEKRHEINGMSKLFKQYLGYKSCEKGLYPDFVCDICYEQLKSFDEFKKMTKNSFRFLKNLLNSKPNQPADPPFEIVQEKSEENEVPLIKFEVSDDFLEDPFLCNDTNSNADTKSCFEEIFVAPEVKEEENDFEALLPLAEFSLLSPTAVVNKQPDIPKENTLTLSPEPVKKKKEKSPRQSTKFTLECSKCNSTFSSTSLLKSHMRLHKEKPSFPCDKCDRSFDKKIRLQNHLQEVHADNPIIIHCRFGCGKTFTRSESASNHYRLKHILPEKGIKPNDVSCICEECGKLCKNKSILKMHRNQHLPPEERPHQCEVCNKRFSSKKHIKEHMMRHAGIKNYECPHCGLKKTTITDLQVHINYHTKEKQWPCNICGKNFPNSGNMKRHKEVVHQGLKKYNCRYCDQSFGKPDTRKYHEMRHTGERPNKCEICDRSFIQPVALKTHMKIHNKESVAI